MSAGFNPTTTYIGDSSEGPPEISPALASQAKEACRLGCTSAYSAGYLKNTAYISCLNACKAVNPNGVAAGSSGGDNGDGPIFSSGSLISEADEVALALDGASGDMPAFACAGEAAEGDFFEAEEAAVDADCL
eukprot:tig00000900_g5355.t1